MTIKDQYAYYESVTPPRRDAMHLLDDVNSRTIRAEMELPYNPWERYLYD